MLNEYSYYYTIQDVLNDWNIDTPNLKALIANVPQFIDYLKSYGEIPEDDAVKTLFSKYIFPKTFSSIVCIETDGTDTEHEEFIGDLIEWLNYSYDRYSPILLAYQDNKANLMSKLVSVMRSDSRTSDTPEVNGDWDGDEQLSGVSKSTTSTENDSGTIMSRLREIQRDYRSIMSEWCKDFERRFCMEVLTW